METQFPIIKNLDKLATTRLRQDALSILEAGYESIIVDKLIRSNIYIDSENNICINDRKICLDDYKRIFFIAIGKCAVSSASVFEELLGDKIENGIVLDVKEKNFKRFISEAGTHPLPSTKNISVTKSIVDLLEEADKNDLIITVISGGGSSLLCLPYKIECDDVVRISRELMNKGANIHELNTVRKHISSIKGGQFAKLAYPATVVSFILSDVPGDDLSVIASGPTVMDKTTKEDTEKILEKYNLREDLSNIDIQLLETPKEEKYFEKVTNILLGSNLFALEEMKKKAESLGYNAYIEDTKLEGEARVLGEKLISKEYLPNSCHLWGGETTVKVLNNQGIGGRNQEFVLSALPHIKENMIVIGSASDGWDNSDMAGAIGDIDLFDLSLNKGLKSEEYLDENNSYEFFEKAGGHIRTDRTGSNVADFYLILKGEQGLEESEEYYRENDGDDEEINDEV